MIFNDMSVYYDGMKGDVFSEHALNRAVVISLFTWRRANPDDKVDDTRMGFWGDSVEPPVANDKIGSRLWLLRREKLVNSTFNRAREYAQEALQWMIDQSIATRIDVVAERHGVNGLAMQCTVYRSTGAVVDIRFDKTWEYLNVV